MTIVDRVGLFLFFLLRSFPIKKNVGSVTILAMVALKMLPTDGLRPLTGSVLFGTFKNEKYGKPCLEI